MPRALLLSTYDLGRQPVGLGGFGARLRAEGFVVDVIDLSLEPLDEARVAAADLIGWYLPMQLAAQLALAAIERARALNSRARLVAFGLYATLYAQLLQARGVEVIEDDARPPFDRTGLPDLDRYARLVVPDGPDRVVGVTVGTVGCRHRCRHCPIVPVFDGRFRAVPPDAVLADIERLVKGGAQHITFADPDFLNGPAHARRLAAEFGRRWPNVSFDVTARVSHLLSRQALLAELAESGCVLVTTALESFDPVVLERLDKGHTVDDITALVALCREVGLALNPTLVPFTPWTTRSSLERMLDAVDALGLVDAIAPVQYSIRLILTARSRLWELPEIAALAGAFDAVQLCHPWAHPDPAVDRLQRTWAGLVVGDPPRRWLVGALRATLAGEEPPPFAEAAPQLATIPYFTEPWFC